MTSPSHRLAPVAVLPAGKGNFKLYFLTFPQEGLLPPSALFPSVFCRLSCWAFNFPLVFGSKESLYSDTRVIALVLEAFLDILEFFPEDNSSLRLFLPCCLLNCAVGVQKYSILAYLQWGLSVSNSSDKQR